jgi:hypothetical protein
MKNAVGALQKDRVFFQRAADFVPDDKPAHGRAYHHVDPVAQLSRKALDQRAGQPSCALGIHEHARALEVMRGMAAGGEQEMPFEQGFAGAKFGEDGFVCHGVVHGAGSKPVVVRSASPISAWGRLPLFEHRARTGLGSQAKRIFFPARLRPGQTALIGRSEPARGHRALMRCPGRFSITGSPPVA